MIKLKADIHGKQHDIRLLRTGESVSAEIDGRAYEVEVRNPVGAEYVIRHGTRIYVCRLSTSGKQPGSFEVNIRGTDHAIQIIDPKRSRGVQSAGEHDHGATQIIAPMPGKVVRLLVEVGSQVEAGAGVVVG